MLVEYNDVFHDLLRKLAYVLLSLKESKNTVPSANITKILKRDIVPKLYPAIELFVTSFINKTIIGCN